VFYVKFQEYWNNYFVFQVFQFKFTLNEFASETCHPIHKFLYMYEAFKILWDVETSTVTERQAEATKNYHNIQH